MDKKNTIIAVSLGVIVVLGFVAVGIWFMYPKGPNTQVARNGSTQYVQGATPLNGGVESVAPTAVPEATQSPTTITNQQFLILDGSTLDSHNNGTVSPAPNSNSSNPIPATQVPVTQVPVATATPSATIAVATPLATKVPAIARKTPVPAPARTAAARVPTPAKETVAKRDGEYWIQVFSSPNRDRVDQVRKDLVTLGFNGRITAFRKGDADFYRLRYGPYYQKNEAEKFLDWVKVIKGLNTSYLVEEKATAAKSTIAPVSMATAKPSTKPVASSIPQASPVPTN